MMEHFETLAPWTETAWGAMGLIGLAMLAAGYVGLRTRD